MSLRVRGYDADGHKLYEDLGPAEHVVGHGYHLGGRAIEPSVTLTDKERASLAQQRYKEKRLRGAALFDPETGAWKK